jgi:hypothetical protein
MGARLHAEDFGGQRWKVEMQSGVIVWLDGRSARSLELVASMPPLVRRGAIIANAEQFIGDEYFWGGRTPGGGEGAAGVDCSGLVNLAYRTAGVDIPRDAHEQYLQARAPAALQPADLIFLSEPGNPSTVVHVMLYAGGGEVIEGPGTGESVRRISLAQRLGIPVEALRPGAVVNGQTISFGSYLQ